MGQKVHPTGFRLGISTEYTSKWYAGNKDYSSYLLEDYRIREYLKKQLENASVSKIVIERPTKEAVVNIYTSRPGIVIGKKGEDIEKFRNKIASILNTDKATVKVNVKEIKKPELDAQLVAEGITQQLERRIMYSLRRIDPVGVVIRWARKVYRRVYSVPGPHYLWHMDTNHKVYI